jgi:hypothetical protein
LGNSEGREAAREVDHYLMGYTNLPTKGNGDLKSITQNKTENGCQNIFLTAIFNLRCPRFHYRSCFVATTSPRRLAKASAPVGYSLLSLTHKTQQY